ncbi:Wzz/FepE/Etk N-terminal domain-containing protein [uncultured Bacteroides sp.]|uniref:Wzz/FepE/Etk N-terminal domain-containing protein n=1 Tax=uncultured Bacteroides sp. TaxID=162156 RepID=UPI00260D2FED|nr:Wzz/FepE/Etk N-terminal domain-containing protein [uncultured Bacteroides sp.]
MEQDNKQLPVEEQEIDLIELARKVWAERKLVLKWCGIAAVVGLVVAFSIPKEYTTTATIAPEITGDNRLRGLGNITNFFGGGGLNGATDDALSPELYPDLVSSVNFATELFDVPVRDADNELQTTVYDYLQEHQRSPWWSVIVSLPFKCIGWTVSLFTDDEPADSTGVNPFRLTEEEDDIVTALNDRIEVSVDKKTLTVSIAVTMQDPLISATLTDTVMQKLQEYITDYRTSKARHDLDFTQKLYDEARQKYYEAQQRYADYVDKNQNILLRSVQTRQERLQNEMNLAYNLYDQTARQLQLAKAKVQENTPVYTVVQAPTVPLRASKPSKVLILIGFVFLAGVGTAGWILFGRDLIRQFKEPREQA